MTRLRFELEAIDAVELPAYPGSAIRGVLGHALRRTVCVTRQSDCRGCLLQQTCIYRRLFEPAGKATGAAAAPHPYVMEIDPQAPRRSAPGEDFHFGLILIGNALDSLPYLIPSLERAGARGIGRGHGRFRLASVWQQPAPDREWLLVYRRGGDSISLPVPDTLEPPPPPAEVIVQLLTPLRLKRHGRLLGPREFCPSELFWSLRHRLTALQMAFGDRRAPTLRDAIGDPDLHVAALESDLRWYDWTRYSSRQGTYMQMGGLAGSLRFDGGRIGPLWPMLWLGQWVHAGKATTMGLGGYRLRHEASLLVERPAAD